MKIRHILRTITHATAGVIVFVLTLQPGAAGSADKGGIPREGKPRAGAVDPPADLEAALQAAKIDFEKDDEGNITSVTFGSEEKGPLSISNLRLVAKIPSLKTLGSRLSFEDVTTDKLAAIANIKSLESLKLDCCRFKGSDLKKLAGLPKLTTIDWTDSQIDDDAMRGLGTLKFLTVLKLRGNQVTDTGIKFLTKLKDLEEINFDKSKDDVHIEKAVPITDASLVPLKAMKRLRTLSLRRNAISDAGLKHLADFKNLKELDLIDTQVTDAGIAKLKMALPECKITTRE